MNHSHGRSSICLATVLFSGCLAADAPLSPEWRHGISYFGDFKYPADFAHFDYVNPTAPKGGVLVRPLDRPYNSFTPFIAKGVSAPGVGVIGQMTMYDSLVWPSSDEVGVYYGNLAEAVAVSDDATEVRMRLRREARWHDGVPVTARDVKFTFEHIRDNAFPGVKAAFLSIADVEILAEREVRFRYRHPVNKNAMTALGKVAILPEHYWREHDHSKTTVEAPLGSGPYRIGEFEIGKFIEFERVPDYWGRHLALHQGRHNFDTLRFDVYRDMTVRREALRKGLLDFHTETNAAQWATGYDLPVHRDGLLVQELHAFKQYLGVTKALAFNLTQERFQDARVREALVLAFNLDWTNRVLNSGIYAIPKSYFHGSFLAATGLPGDGEHELLAPFAASLPARVFREAPFGKRPSKGLSARDAMLRAQSLLDAAGWRVQGGWRRDSSGSRFDIEFLVNTREDQRLLLPYVDRLERLGIRGRIRLVETAQFLNIRRKNENDAVIGSLGIAFPPNQEVYAYFGSSSLGTANFARLSSPVVDSLLDAIMDAATRQELTDATRALDRVLWWNFYFVPLRVLEGVRVVYWDKFGRPDSEPPYRTEFPEGWWYDEGKAARVEAVLGNL